MTRMATTQSAASTKPPTAKGVVVTDQDIQIGKDGTVKIDPAASHQDEQGMGEKMEDTGRWLVLPRPNDDFAENLRKLAVFYQDPTQRMAMVTAFGVVTDLVVKQAGAPPSDGDAAGTAPQYQGLPEAAVASANAVDQFPVATHNAHADSGALRSGAETLTCLLALDQILEQGSEVIGQTTAPLARGWCCSTSWTGGSIPTGSANWTRSCAAWCCCTWTSAD